MTAGGQFSFAPGIQSGDADIFCTGNFQGDLGGGGEEHTDKGGEFEASEVPELRLDNELQLADR